MELITATTFWTFVKKHLTPEIIRHVAESTTSQADSPLWHEIRYCRITASKLYDLAFAKKTDGVLVEQIVGAKKLKDTAAMARGRKLETEVLKLLKNKLKKKIERVGFYIDSNNPIVGASPISDPQSHSLCDVSYHLFCLLE